MRWFVRADVDGFFGLALDNLVQLLVIVNLCEHVLGFSDSLVYQHILPGAFVVERLRQATPRAALLSTLSGIALTFISLGFLFRTYAHPVVGLVTLGVILLIYFGKLRFRGNIPGGLVAVVLGVLLSWLMGLAPVGALPHNDLSLNLPIPAFGDLFAVLSSKNSLSYLSVIIPMGLFNVIGSLQNIESAEAAGDSYPTQSSLAVNGIGTLAASLFGSCFPTTIYIGHPGWKAMGARAGYSILNGTVITLICLTGSLSYIAWAIPVDAGMAIVLWIGIVIAAQAFQETPKNHAPAVVMGLLPGIAAWGAFMAKSGVRAADYGTAQMSAFSESMLARFQQSDIWIHGAFALEQGFIFTAMILAALTVAIIERHFVKAALWSGAASLLSAGGLIHSYRWTVSDTALSLTPAWEWAIAYAIMGLLFLTAKWVCVED